MFSWHFGVIHHLFLSFSMVRWRTNTLLQICCFHPHFICYIIPCDFSFLAFLHLAAGLRSSHFCVFAQLHLRVSEGIIIHQRVHTHTHTHKNNMSLLHSPETSCHWEELKMPPMRMWKQANINRCARSYIWSMYACLFHSLGFILMCVDIQISTRITGNMMRHAHNAYSAGVEGSRRVEPCVKPRSALSCFRRNTPRNSVVCGAKTSAAAGRATYCTMTQNTNSRTHKFMHMSRPGTWRTQTPQQVLQVSLSLLAFQSLLIPSVLCCSDSWESKSCCG